MSDDIEFKGVNYRGNKAELGIHEYNARDAIFHPQMGVTAIVLEPGWTEPVRKNVVGIETRQREAAASRPKLTAA